MLYPRWNWSNNVSFSCILYDWLKVWWLMLCGCDVCVVGRGPDAVCDGAASTQQGPPSHPLQHHPQCCQQHQHTQPLTSLPPRVLATTVPYINLLSPHIIPPSYFEIKEQIVWNPSFLMAIVMNVCIYRMLTDILVSLYIIIYIYEVIYIYTYLSIWL